MPKKKAKRELEDNQLLNKEQKASENPYGTQWPATIGRKQDENDDGKIRDCWGTIMS